MNKYLLCILLCNCSEFKVLGFGNDIPDNSSFKQLPLELGECTNDEQCQNVNKNSFCHKEKSYVGLCKKIGSK